MAKKLLFPEDLGTLLKRRYKGQHHHWLVAGGTWPLCVSLNTLTERDVVSDAALVRTWIEEWTAWNAGGALLWSEMKWPRIGPQRVPTRLDLSSAVEVARIVGEGPRFELAQQRYEECARRWPGLRGSTAISRSFDVLADYDEAQYQRLIALISWLHDNPGSAHFLRQLPVRGIDTKWIEGGRRTVVSGLIQAMRADQRPGDFYDVCGLQRYPHRLRLRLLCPKLREAVGGMSDVEAPIEEIARLPLSLSRALLIENLETGLALPDIAGCAAFVKLGNSVTSLARVSWLKGVPILYWGDLDTHGFAILERARAALRNVTSLLMDESTLLTHRDLWGHEATQHTEMELPHLTAPERDVFEKLRANEWGHAVRLEQERIPWGEALAAILEACASPS